MTGGEELLFMQKALREQRDRLTRELSVRAVFQRDGDLLTVLNIIAVHHDNEGVVIEVSK
jgi:hypothetical protein